MKHKLESRLPGEISVTLDTDDTTLMAESEEELKSLLKVKEESEKVSLKLNIQKTKIMASGPITSWQIDVETVRDFILLGSKITADGDCNHEIKRGLLLGRKVTLAARSVLPSNRPATRLFSPACWEPGFQAWAQSTGSEEHTSELQSP